MHNNCQKHPLTVTSDLTQPSKTLRKTTNP